jgi:uncharacterized protein (TIGR02145 family)
MKEISKMSIEELRHASRTNQALVEELLRRMEEVSELKEPRSIWKDSILLPGYYTQQEAIDACPKGYRLPTREEFVQLVRDAEYSFDGYKKVGVFTFPDGFKVEFPAAGYRNYSTGTLPYIGSNGYYWSYSPNGGNGYTLHFNSGNVNPSSNSYRANGFSVRCIAENK